MEKKFRKKQKKEEKTFKKLKNHFLSWHLFSVEEIFKKQKAAKVFSWNWRGHLCLLKCVTYFSFYLKSKIQKWVTKLQHVKKKWRVFQKKNLKSV